MNLKYVKIRKQALPQQTRTELIASTTFCVVITGIFTWMAIWFFYTNWQWYLLDKRFELEGVQTVGFVSAFRYVGFTGKNSSRKSGDYPIVTIHIPSGIYQLPISTSTMRPLNKVQKEELLGKSVDVIYLKNEPNIARAIRWEGSKTSWLFIFFGVFAFIPALCLSYLSYRIAISRF